MDPESTKCQRDAVVALEALAFTPENPVLVTDSLQVDEVLTFIGAQWDPDCRRAAVGLLSLVAKDNPQIALRSVELIADLLQCQDATAARRAADVLLNFAGANSQVRLQIAKVNVLDALLNLQPSDMEYREKLISTLILFCQSGGDEDSQVYKTTLSINSSHLNAEHIYQTGNGDVSIVTCNTLNRDCTATKSPVERFLEHFKGAPTNLVGKLSSSSWFASQPGNPF